MEKRKNVNNNISFAVLTGGLSTRFGQNKLVFKIDEKSILDIVLELVPPRFPLYIIGEKHTDKKITAFNDIEPGLGPLGGIYTALKKIRSKYLFILGGDMPFINPQLLNEMVKLVPYKNADIIAPLNNGFYEPLFAIYSRRVLKTAEEQINRKSYKITDLYKNLRVFIVEEEFWKKYDREGMSFVNINTTEDLTKFNELFKKCSD
ncbi:MAG TPA: molybdenum cofactor guanylyltransferase [Firmicutes bacterium]|nr:molybdenum cofactor guanylyltransferase [Bacillota bacterium]